MSSFNSASGKCSYGTKFEPVARTDQLIMIHSGRDCHSVLFGEEMGTVENVKDLASLIKKLGDMELYRKILDLQNEVMELSEENRTLTRESRELADKLDLAGQMTFTEPFWYRTGDRVPYCPACWESKKLASHLHYKGLMSGGHRYDCSVCDKFYCSKRTPPHHTESGH